MMKKDLDLTLKHPTILIVYGGPGVQVNIFQFSSTWHYRALFHYPQTIGNSVGARTNACGIPEMVGLFF